MKDWKDPIGVVLFSVGLFLAWPPLMFLFLGACFMYDPPKKKLPFTVENN